MLQFSNRETIASQLEVGIAQLGVPVSRLGRIVFQRGVSSTLLGDDNTKCERLKTQPRTQHAGLGRGCSQSGRKNFRLERFVFQHGVNSKQLGGVGSNLDVMKADWGQSIHG